MGDADEMPTFMPKPELHITITGGVLSFASTSKLVNPADYGWNPAEVTGTAIKNGTSNTALTINSSTGAITCSGIGVATGDKIEVRFDFLGPVGWPWAQKFVLRRSAFFDVPSGTSSFDFDDSTNVMPVPSLDLAFGWDNNDKLKVGVKVNNADGASQNYTLYTRRAGGPQETSSTVSTSDTTNAQTQTSSFSKSDVTSDCEWELWLKSGTGSTRMEDRSHVVFADKGQLASYPSNFPGSCKLTQRKDTGRSTLDSPH